MAASGERRSRANLSKGFNSLSLDPSSRLRARRHDHRRQDPTAEAWQETAEALAEAVRMVGRNIRGA